MVCYLLILFLQKGSKICHGSHVMLNVLNCTRQLESICMSKRITMRRMPQISCLIQSHVRSCRFNFITVPGFILALWQPSHNPILWLTHTQIEHTPLSMVHVNALISANFVICACSRLLNSICQHFHSSPSPG